MAENKSIADAKVEGVREFQKAVDDVEKNGVKATSEDDVNALLARFILAIEGIFHTSLERDKNNLAAIVALYNEAVTELNAAHSDALKTIHHAKGHVAAVEAAKKVNEARKALVPKVTLVGPQAAEKIKELFDFDEKNPSSLD
jgi:hypothetical protein